MEKSYSKLAVLLHAIQGLLIVFVLVTGTFILSEIPNTLEKLDNFKIHMILGLVILILTVIRFIVVKKENLEPLQMPPLRAKIMKINHNLIYLVLMLVAISGIALAKGSGLGEIVFWGANLELYNSFKDFPMGIAHGILTKILIFLIVMHLVGVISYKLKTDSNVLKRICFK